MTDYYARLANCPLPGIEWTEITRNGAQWKTRNLIRLQTSGFELELRQQPDLWKSRYGLAGQCVDTTDLFVRNVAEDSVERLRSVIGYTCDLLSFATESRVLPYFSEYPAGSGRWSSQSMTGTIQIWRPPFEETENAKQLVDTCYDKYVELYGRRKLHVVIDYIHHSVMKGLAVEVQVGVACIAFENLRDSFARDDGYPHIDGYFQEKGTVKKDRSARVGIKRHLNEMFAAVGMKADTDRIVDTRNEVVHTGLYGQGDVNEIHEFLETTLREYFLRLVGYHGTFVPYRGGSPTPIKI
jgi:hypothetical protein